jgi:hypothetical protein
MDDDHTQTSKDQRLLHEKLDMLEDSVPVNAHGLNWWTVRLTHDEYEGHQALGASARLLIEILAFMGGTIAVPSHWFGGLSGSALTS